ncbi:hypothetical protein B808_518 [Fructilactobacillus florum 8D]|uniref:Uncharacterized protein n=1 Tax=Fructilactobacillus florum 8D TaxID=1221538 RepID=W9ELL7_9LACO|nr:hypothetical protein [Fructilactobacillus florum]EKK20409.1 hypothetical protein B807_818 [Fructilactobacillus florum 2F]ETO40569.1 hypothetical protein B808_518 [Fructilactobacillus florum 8D]
MINVDPIIDQELLDKAKKAAERKLVEFAGTGALRMANGKDKMGENTIKSLVRGRKSKISQLRGHINSAIKGKFAKSVAQEAKKQADKLDEI